MTSHSNLPDPGKGPGLSLLVRASPLVLARAMSALISFTIPLVLVRTFSPSIYGTYKQLLLVSQTLYYLLPFGMTQSLYFFLPRKTVLRPYYIQTLLFLSAAGALACGGLILGAGLIGHWMNNPLLPRYLPAVAVYTMGLIGSTPLEVAWTANGRTMRAALAYFISELAKAAAMTLPALMGFGLQGVALGLAAFGLSRWAATWIFHGRGSRGPLFDKAAWWAQARFAIPFGAAVALMVPQQALHQYLVSAGLSAGLFAVYAVGTFQVPVFELLYGPASEMLMVRLAELEKEGRGSDGAQVFRDAVQKLALVFFPLTAFLFVLAPQFITLLFTDRYLDAVPVFRLSVLAGLLTCFPMEGVLRAYGETRHILVSSAIKLGITVPLVMICVMRWGMVGGTISWLIAEIVGKLALSWRLPAVLKIKAGQVLPLNGLARPAMAAVVAALGAGATRALILVSHHALLRISAISVAYGVFYVGALTMLGVRLPKEITQHWQLISRWRIVRLFMAREKVLPRPDLNQK